jgi:hypothetical protein
MQTIVPIKPHGEFTDSHLEVLKSNLRMKAFPQFYTNSEFKSLKYEDLKKIPAELIDRDGYGSSQPVRAEGKNHQYDILRADLLENGYRLYEKPIFVKRNTGGRFRIIDGRTKDKILEERKFKNRLCVIIEINEDEEVELGNRLNAGEDNSPAGLIKEVDIIELAQKKIVNGTLELNPDVIRTWIDKICGKGKFSSKRRSDLAFQIYNHANAIQSSSLLPVAWSNGKEVDSWLIGKKYIETSNVIYLPVAASSPMKGMFAAARLSQQKPNKEVRVIVYVSKLNGYDLKKCYVNACLRFKEAWFEYLDLLSDKYYHGAKPVCKLITLYGYVPSNIESVCDDMEKLIVIGKTDRNINYNYVTSSTLSTFFDLNDIEEDEDE